MPSFEHRVHELWRGNVEPRDDSPSSSSTENVVQPLSNKIVQPPAVGGFQGLNPVLALHDLPPVVTLVRRPEFAGLRIVMVRCMTSFGNRASESSRSRFGPC